MKIKDRAKPKTPPLEPGVYLAVCVGVIDLGEQLSEKFKSYANRVKFLFEIAGETVLAGGEEKPRLLSREFTVSTDRKGSIRPFLESWNGQTYTNEAFGELDLLGQLGRPCQLQVTLNDTGEYANVANVMALPRGMTPPVPRTPYLRWDMDEWDDGRFAALPEWIQTQIRKSTQYQTQHVPTGDVEIPQEEACPI